MTPQRTIPRWLIDAGHQTEAPGIAIGFAAAGYLQGWDDALRVTPGMRRDTGTGWPREEPTDAR